MQFKASAPGSLMLLGEYAVLYGKPALVCAVDKRVHVTLTPRSDTRIEIHSELHGLFATDLHQLDIQKPYTFVTAALKHFQTKLRRGCDIVITSEFSDQVGFGSSAAVTVAVLAALVTWMDIKILPTDLLRHGRNVIRSVQGIGSGADVAASVYGGMVSYQAQPLTAEKLPFTHPVTALYAGFKMPTVDAITHVQTRFAAHTNVFRQLMNCIGQCALEGVQFARKGSWDQLGAMMDVQQGLMTSLGVNLPLLQTMIEELRQQSGMLGAKISGSGLGDCVIGLGSVDANYQSQLIPVEMSMQGVQCEKI